MDPVDKPSDKQTSEQPAKEADKPSSWAISNPRTGNKLLNREVAKRRAASPYLEVHDEVRDVHKHQVRHHNRESVLRDKVDNVYLPDSTGHHLHNLVPKQGPGDGGAQGHPPGIEALHITRGDEVHLVAVHAYEQHVNHAAGTTGVQKPPSLDMLFPIQAEHSAHVIELQVPYGPEHKAIEPFDSGQPLHAQLNVDEPSDHQKHEKYIVLFARAQAKQPVEN